MTLDPLVLALSTIPNLQTVDVTVAPEFAPQLGRLSDTSFRSLFTKCPYLQDVSLWEFGLDNRHMAVLKEAVPSHRCLQFLSLRRNGNITADGWQTVSDMMELNTTLVSLYYDDDATASSTTATTTTTTTSTTATADSSEYLADLHERIRLFLWLNQLGRGGLLNSITKNSRIAVTGTTKAAMRVVAVETRAGPKPHRLRLPCSFLNSTVRQCHDWLSFLDRVSGDPDALYYLLQAHPQFCGGRAGPTTTTTSSSSSNNNNNNKD
jgi:hypothetical protein